MHIFLLSELVLRSHNLNLLSCGYGSGENSSEGNESTFIGRGHHLRDVDHQRSFGVTTDHSLGAFVIHGTLIQISGSVFLSVLGRRQVSDHHFQNCIGGVDPSGHSYLQQLLSSESQLFLGQVYS